jgi:hypothetical protein
MQLWHAHLDTGKDTFDAYGRSKDKALKALEKAVSNHAWQSDLPISWAHQYFRSGDFADSVWVRHFLVDSGYRYGTETPMGYA